MIKFDNDNIEMNLKFEKLLVIHMKWILYKKKAKNRLELYEILELA